MKYLSILLFILLNYYCNPILAQTAPKYYIDIPSTSSSEIFEKTFDILFESENFIQFANKDIGLIQCKHIFKNKRIVTTKDADIIEYNIRIQSLSPETIRISFQANQKEKLWTGSVGNSSNYDNDLGVTTEAKHYAYIINFLKENL